MNLESIGSAHEHDVCDECKEKIEEYMSKKGKLIMLRPLKAAKDLNNLACDGCKKNIRKGLNGRLRV